MTQRICFECDHQYRGGLKCPACEKLSGEPLDHDDRSKGQEGEYQESLRICDLLASSSGMGPIYG